MSKQGEVVGRSNTTQEYAKEQEGAILEASAGGLSNDIQPIVASRSNTVGIGAPDPSAAVHEQWSDDGGVGYFLVNEAFARDYCNLHSFEAR